MYTLNLMVNGRKVGPMPISEEIMMIEFLHEYLNLTGTKFGCGLGQCHACTVIVDLPNGKSETRRTCISSALTFNNLKIRTIEGHASKNSKGELTKLHPVQEAFIKHYSFQCGWCTSGFTNEAIKFYEDLKKTPIKKEDVETQIEKALGEHLCRCTGYKKYYGAMKDLIISSKGLTV